MLDISVWDISGKKKSRFVPVAEPSVAIIVILSMEIAGFVILMCVTTGSVAAPTKVYYLSRSKVDRKCTFHNKIFLDSRVFN